MAETERKKPKGGAIMNKKIDSLYAAFMLVEILYERGLINKATLDTVREKVKSENPHNSQAA